MSHRRRLRQVVERALSLVAMSIGSTIAAQAEAQLRVVTYNIAQLRGDVSAFRDVLRWIGDDPDPETGVIRSPDIVVFQEVLPFQLVSLEQDLEMADRLNIDYAAATFTDDSGSDTEQALLVRTDSIAEVAGGYRSLSNHTGPRRTDRWLCALTSAPETTFYIYGAHLKADSGTENEARRTSEVNAIRLDADTLGSAHVVYSGDFNVYGPTEPAFLRFFDAGPGQAVDPRFNRTFPALSDTQSPFDEGTSWNLVGGGLDDRFDFLLTSQEFMGGGQFGIRPASYRSFGNDGNHFNQSVNAGVNSYFDPTEQHKAGDLAVASDHLPVVADFDIPGATFSLAADALTAGRPASLHVTGGGPNQNVYYFYSTQGMGVTEVSQLAVTLRLEQPILAGKVRSDSTGAAVLSVQVPPDRHGARVWFQAAQRQHATDPVYRQVL